MHDTLRSLCSLTIDDLAHFWSCILRSKEVLHVQPALPWHLQTPYVHALTATLIILNNCPLCSFHRLPVIRFFSQQWARDFLLWGLVALACIRGWNRPLPLSEENHKWSLHLVHYMMTYVATFSNVDTTLRYQKNIQTFKHYHKPCISALSTRHVSWPWKDATSANIGKEGIRENLN